MRSSKRVETVELFDLPVRFHAVHRWFAWWPVFTPDRGWCWLKMVHRQYTSKVHANGIKTWCVEHWLSRPKNQPEDEYGLWTSASPAPVTAQKDQAE